MSLNIPLDFGDPRGSPGIAFKNVRGQIGDGDSQIFGDILGKNPRKTSNFGAGTGATVLGDFGDTMGTGTAKNSGIFWGKIPEKPQNSGWGRGQDFRGICTLF